MRRLWLVSTLLAMTATPILAAGCRAIYPYSAAAADADAMAADVDAAGSDVDAAGGDGSAPLDIEAIDGVVVDSAVVTAPRFALGWVKRFSSSAPDEASAVAVDDQGNVYAAGFLMAGIDFGGGSRGTDGLPDAWLVRYAASGDHDWSILLPGSSFDYAYGLAVTGKKIALAGTFFDAIDFGGGVKQTVVSSSDVLDIFEARQRTKARDREQSVTRRNLGTAPTIRPQLWTGSPSV